MIEIHGLILHTKMEDVAPVVPVPEIVEEAEITTAETLKPIGKLKSYLYEECKTSEPKANRINQEKCFDKKEPNVE